MQCPSYVVSNDAGVLKQFAESYDELVLKPLHERTTCFESDGKSYAIYVKKFTCPELADLFERPPPSPLMLQHYVRKQADIRVTVIGEKIFPVMIRPTNERDEIVDFRPRCLEMKHEVVACPVELTKSILSYMDIMGLNFAAFDFALDYEGRWVFLECNPNGQWLWLGSSDRTPAGRDYRAPFGPCRSMPGSAGAVSVQLATPDPTQAFPERP
ncbi:MAG TPA: hypothetical protein VIT00_08220 [Terrimicrobiaceae bacterium]